MVKEYLPEKQFELRETPCLELYEDRLKHWPPKPEQNGFFTIRYACPIEPMPVVEEEKPTNDEAIPSASLS